MTEKPYPEGIDCIWVATDRYGHLGAFVTGGTGPISADLLCLELSAVEEIEQCLGRLPRVTRARILVSIPRPDDFIEIAERGLFVYDWTDVHRTTHDAVQAYELVAIPEEPIAVSTLSSAIESALNPQHLGDVSFSDSSILDVRKYINCRESP